MTQRVLAPVAGIVVNLSEVPDPVFAGEIVGPGLAIEPLSVAEAEAVAPIDGKIVKLHPHAFVVQAADGNGVLVHLGLDTVQLEGKGFTLLVAEGDDVKAGQALITWSPEQVVAGGRSAVTPVIALQAGKDAVLQIAQPGDEIAAGESFFDWL